MRKLLEKSNQHMHKHTKKIKNGTTPYRNTHSLIMEAKVTEIAGMSFIRINGHIEVSTRWMS